MSSFRPLIPSQKALRKRELTDTCSTECAYKSRYDRILERVLRDLNQGTSKKAIRILEWVACSLRMLKIHEIQDGIVLHTMDIEINERTKLRDGKFLDLCKPIIEEGPNNTVDFIHYSARECVDVFPALTVTKFVLGIS
jgi:hypothetical protein